MYKAIMQVNFVDAAGQLTIIGQLHNILKELPKTEIVVICHADGLDLVLKGASRVIPHIEELATQNVRFAACEKTMVRRNLPEGELVPGVAVVASGLAEIIVKQAQGWSYILGGRGGQR